MSESAFSMKVYCISIFLIFSIIFFSYLNSITYNSGYLEGYFDAYSDYRNGAIDTIHNEEFKVRYEKQ